MPTTYPSGLDAFPNPGAATLEDAAGFYHDEQHANANDAIEALQAKLGISESVPADAPAANTVLQSLANGRSKWAQIPAGALAPGSAWVPLGSASGAAAYYELASIPQTYAALAWVLYGRTDQAVLASPIWLRVNGDSGANFDDMSLVGSGTTPTASERYGQNQIVVGYLAGASVGATQPGMIEGLIPTYAGTAHQKACRSIFAVRFGASTGNLQVGTVGGFWRNAAAITAIRLQPASGSFIAGTVARFWGVP